MFKEYSNPILATEKGLPPGLWLPTAEESTEQYLHENFDRPDLAYEDLVDYGAFMVSLIRLEQENTGRVSLMPRWRDVKDMYRAGYGISINKVNNHQGGVQKLQRALGFFPIDYEPTKDELMERFQWMADYAYPYETSPNFGDDPTIYDIIEWGSVRHLSPSSKIVYEVMEGDTTPIRKMFAMEIRDAVGPSSYTNLFRFGARVLLDRVGLPKRDEVDQQYAHEFPHMPSNMIKARFPTYREFWTEFDFIPDTHGMKRDQFLLIGLRWAISNGRSEIGASEIDQLSKEGKFISRLPIYKHFDGRMAYCQEVDLLYQQYLEQQAAFAEQGVAEHIFRAACRKYEQTPEFEEWLQAHAETMAKLSVDSEPARYVSAILRDGLDLLRDEIYDLQLQDIKTCLRKLGIKSRAEMHFVFSIIPRIDPDEALA